MSEPVPPPLRPAAAAPRPGPWLEQHVAGVVALVIGAVAFSVVAIRQDTLWAQPDWRLTLPFFMAALVATVISFARKEGLVALPLLGLGLAAVTLVLGWFVVMGAIVAVTAILILVMSAVM